MSDNDAVKPGKRWLDVRKIILFVVVSLILLQNVMSSIPH